MIFHKKANLQVTDTRDLPKNWQYTIQLPVIKSVFTIPECQTEAKFALKKSADGPSKKLFNVSTKIAQKKPSTSIS